MMKTAAIVLAAGRSSRMQRFKPLLPLGRSSLIGTAVSALRAGGVGRIILVTGRESERLTAHLHAALGDGAPLQCCHNPDWAEADMFSSVKLGLARAGDAESVFLLPGDIPLFTGETVAAMKRHMAGEGPDALLPTHLGRHGHPILLNGRLAPRILADSGERGLKGALGRSAKRVAEMHVPDWGVLLDADLPAEYALLCLLEQAQGLGKIYAHSRLVARLALGLAALLNAAGHSLDLLSVELAALLHDAERAEKNHAQRMAQRLYEAGLDSLGRIVAGHMLPPPDEWGTVNETTVVYLADKMAQEDAPVGLAQRYGPRLAADGAAGEKARMNYRVACDLMTRFEQDIGPVAPERLLQAADGILQTGSAHGTPHRK